MENITDIFTCIDVTDESQKAKPQCKICPNAVFDKKALLTKHIKKYHKKDDKYVCDKCIKTCTKFSNLAEHYKSNHSQPLTSTGLTGEASTRATYECKICDVFYEANFLLRKHKKETHMTYTCDKCKYKNKDFTSFTQHMKEDHPQPSTSTGTTGGATTRAKYQCEICNNGFEKKTSLSSHMEKAHMKYVCDQCEYTNTRFDKLTNHIKIIHSQLLTLTDETDKASLKDKHLCKICYEYVFENKHSLSFHIKKHHQIYVCHKCTYKCKTFPTLTKHVKTCEHRQPSTSTCIIDEASTIAEYQCEICYCICENEKSLKVHKKDHILYACDKCNYENKNLNNVKRHVKDKHVQPSIIADITDEASRRTEFRCKICDASFENQVLLSLHKEEHHTIYACANCPYIDKALNNVTQHVKLEHSQFSTSTGVTGEASIKAKYQCEICNKVYEKKKFLNLHIRQNHKYYACNKCKYIVISTEFDTLINHVKKCGHPQPSTSTGIIDEASTRTEFQCKICGKPCRNNIDLGLHYDTCHKKNNKFECTKCEHTSEAIMSLEKHMKRYHSHTSIYCVVCEKWFTTKYEYITHQGGHKDLSELDKFNCPKCNKKYEYFSKLEAHCSRMHLFRAG